MDMKDKRILYELDLDSRQSFSQMSKKVGLSQEAVRYRLNKLVQTGVIEKFMTIVNPAKLGFVFHKVLLRLHNIDQQKKEEIFQFLKNNEKVAWVADLDGSYDIGFVVRIENVVELNDFLENIYLKFNTNISKHELSTNIFGEYLLRSYLLNEERKSVEETSYTADKEEYNLDEINLEIIKQLTKDARANTAELARSLNISLDTVLKRIKKLQKDNVISKYNVVANNSKLNQIHYKVLIYLNDFNPDKVSKFLTHCRSINRVVYIIKAMGNWNYELDIEVENIDQFREIMMELTREFSDIIRDYDALIVRKVHKYNYYS